jgi:hypothetical protein
MLTRLEFTRMTSRDVHSCPKFLLELPAMLDGKGHPTMFSICWIDWKGPWNPGACFCQVQFLIRIMDCVNYGTSLISLEMETTNISLFDSINGCNYSHSHSAGACDSVDYKKSNISIWVYFGHLVKSKYHIRKMVLITATIGQTTERFEHIYYYYWRLYSVLSFFFQSKADPIKWRSDGKYHTDDIEDTFWKEENVFWRYEVAMHYQQWRQQTYFNCYTFMLGRSLFDAQFLRSS